MKGGMVKRTEARAEEGQLNKMSPESSPGRPVI